MKFTPRYPHDNVNVSRSHPLTELVWMVGSLVVIIGTLFFLLGLATDYTAEHIPDSVEKWLGKQALAAFSPQQDPQLTNLLTALTESLPATTPLNQEHITVLRDDREDVNAVALPGGVIIVYAGLLREVESENELMMVLAHELGHFAHRDHLRGLGRGLALTVASALLLGKDSAASDVLAKSLLSFQSSYSRQQESAADNFALNLLAAHYGHCGGATDFFARVAQTSGRKLTYIMASHPHPQDRIDRLNRQIGDMQCRSGQVAPISLNTLPRLQ